MQVEEHHRTKGASERVTCSVCNVCASRGVWQRVNHLTGALQPRGEQLKFKVNSRHMERWSARMQ